MNRDQRKNSKDHTRENSNKKISYDKIKKPFEAKGIKK
jgi:hypothetical protein